VIKAANAEIAIAALTKLGEQYDATITATEASITHQQRMLDAHRALRRELSAYVATLRAVAESSRRPRES
jgi:hypothetical protein